MHSAGPEFGMVASLKFQVDGERLIMLAPFDKSCAMLERSYEASAMDKTTITAQNVVDFFSEASDDILAPMGS